MELIYTYVEKESNFHFVAPFLKVYSMVTKNVAVSSIIRRDFDNNILINKLDVEFAELYFEPTINFLNGDIDINNIWHFYYLKVRSKKYSPFFLILCGIFIHINHDLPLALREVNYNQESDFLRINSILESLIPELLRYLAFEELDYIGISGVFLQRIFKMEFQKIIIRWRNEAYKIFRNSELNTKKHYKSKRNLLNRLFLVWEDFQRNKNIFLLVSELENF